MQSRPRQDWSSGDPKRQTPAFCVSARCVDRAPAADGPDQAGLARRGAPACDGRIRRGAQPRLPPRPVRLRPLHVRQRPLALLPGQGVGLPHPRRGRHRPRREADPGLPEHRARGRGLPGRRRGGRGGQVRRRLPRGHPDPRPRPVADGRQDRSRADRARPPGARSIPVAQWGAQEILAPYSKQLRLFPRKTMHVLAGPPVDLVRPLRPPARLRWCCARPPPASWRPSPVCSRSCAARPAPPERFDTRKHGVPETGNPTTRRDTGDDERQRSSAPAAGAPRSPPCSPTPARR